MPNLSTPQLDALWIMLVGSLTGVACALVGNFLVLRRLSLLGDALSHAVLPGLVVAFLLGGQVHVGTMLIGALVVGLLTSVLVELLERRAGVSSDAGMGVVFTGLFALGVLLVDRFADAVDLDPDCVLFGLLEFVPLNTVSVAGHEIPRAALTMAPVLLLDLAVIVLLWKELKLAAFDPGLATALGFSAGRLHYLLMVLVAVTTVAAFEAVGSILVIAMLVAPPAAAHLLTDRLPRMVVLSALFAVASAVGGYLLAARFDTNTAGMIGLGTGAIYFLAALASPRYGLLSRLIQRVGTAVRVASEDLLSLLYRLEELSLGRRLSPLEARRAIGGGWQALSAVAAARWRGAVRESPQGLELTPHGREAARALVRAHRLWESYLVEQLGFAPDHVHEPAERMEHYLGDGLQAAIAADLGHAASDPHGREIPPGPGRRSSGK